jgi:radical SAM protein with 4Fe4S-binding SPASM domain
MNTEKVSLPQDVIIEVTNKCNLKCIMCHAHSEHVRKIRREGFMPEDIWKKVIDEIDTWEHQVSLCTYGAGEPLLYSKIVDVIQFAKSKHNITAGFLTNGMFLNRKKIVDLICSGIDWIALSIDGTDPEFVEKFRKGSNLATIEKNLMALIKEKGKSIKPIIKLNMVLLPGSENQVEIFLRKWRHLVDYIMLSKYIPTGSTSFLKLPIRRRPCFLLKKMIVIAYNGDVALCCSDNLEHKMGNVIDCSIKEVWYGERFREARKLHDDGFFNSIKKCGQCDTWSTDVPITEYLDTNGDNIKIFSNQIVYSFGKKKAQLSASAKRVPIFLKELYNPLRIIKALTK